MTIMRQGWHRLGECGVDSGQLFIVDPCYVKGGLGDAEPEFGDFEERLGIIPVTNGDLGGYPGVVSATMSQHGAGEVEDGVAFRSGVGDGSYAVWGWYDRSGNIMEVRILLGGRPPAGSDREMYALEEESGLDD